MPETEDKSKTSDGVSKGTAVHSDWGLERGAAPSEVLPLWKELFQLKDKCVTISAKFWWLAEEDEPGPECRINNAIIYDANSRYVIVCDTRGSVIGLAEIDTVTVWEPGQTGPTTAELAGMQRQIDNLILKNTNYVTNILELMRASIRFEELFNRYRSDWKNWKEMKT